MSQIFRPNNDAGYCTKCQRGYAIGPHVCPEPCETELRAARLDAAAATGNVEHYTATIEAMIREDQSSEGERNGDA